MALEQARKVNITVTVLYWAGCLGIVIADLGFGLTLAAYSGLTLAFLAVPEG